mgnify:CR=1 FL=1
MSMEIDFTGKVVIVTGATRGIGKNIAENLSVLGATLLLTGTDKNQIKAMNKRLRCDSRTKYFYLDLLNDKSIREFLSDIKSYDKIDVCINNAGINRINYIYNISTKDWDEVIRVNLRGPFILSKEVANIMKKNRYGRIVNIASIFSVITREKRAVYTAAKAGLVGLTKTTAIDLAPYNILVNSVSPGFITTDLTKNILGKREMTRLKSSIPLGRLGAPEDVAGIVLFLSSDMNSYITGQNIIVDGGYVNI